MGAKIQSIKAREIIALRGTLSLEVTVTTDDGCQGVSTPESGVSTGAYEAAFLLDGGERYGGLGVRQAAARDQRRDRAGAEGAGREPSSLRWTG